MTSGTAPGNGASKVSNGSLSADSKSPLKFLFVSLESLSGDLAWTLKKEGHEVKIYLKAKGDEDVYNGFVEKIERWEDWVDWCDVVIFAVKKRAYGYLDAGDVLLQLKPRGFLLPDVFVLLQ